MVHEPHCSECHGFNGEHKPFCTKHTEMAKQLGLRQCDFDDLTFEGMVEVFAKEYNTTTNIILALICNVDLCGLNNEETAAAIFEILDQEDDMFEVFEKYGSSLTLDKAEDIVHHNHMITDTNEVEEDGFITVYFTK